MRYNYTVCLRKQDLFQEYIHLNIAQNIITHDIELRLIFYINLLLRTIPSCVHRSTSTKHFFWKYTYDIIDKLTNSKVAGYKETKFLRTLTSVLFLSLQIDFYLLIV